MKLYDTKGAPSPRRVRLYLAEKTISVETVQVDLQNGEQFGDPYLEINPRAVVPALELDDGEVLSESEAICRYFEALNPEPPLFGTTPVEIGRIASWTRRIEADGYGAVVYVLRNTASAFKDRAEAGNWPALPQIPELATRGAVMWSAFLEGLDARLGEREWIAGDAYSFADITALVAVDFAIRAKLSVPEDAANVQRWHKAASARPSAAA